MSLYDRILDTLERTPTWVVVLVLLYAAIAAYGKFHYLLPWHEASQVHASPADAYVVDPVTGDLVEVELWQVTRTPDADHTSGAAPGSQIAPNRRLIGDLAAANDVSDVRNAYLESQHLISLQQARRGYARPLPKGHPSPLPR